MEKLIKLAGNDELTLNNAQAKAGKVFDLLDVRETTRVDYKYRIGLFLDFVEGKGFNRNSFLAFKRELAERTDLAISTKNKHLTTARVFLKELNRRGFLPADITQNIKTFNQSKKHKKDGLTDEEINTLTEKMRQLPQTPYTTRLKTILALLTLQAGLETDRGN